MLNVPQTIRFVVENPHARWPNLTERERAICAERLRPFLNAWSPELQAEFRTALQSSPDRKFKDLLLKIADDIEAQDEALKIPVPPRTFNRTKDEATFSARGMFPPVRNGGEDHKAIRTRGERN